MGDFDVEVVLGVFDDELEVANRCRNIIDATICIIIFCAQMLCRRYDQRLIRILKTHVVFGICVVLGHDQRRIVLYFLLDFVQVRCRCRDNWGLLVIVFEG